VTVPERTSTWLELFFDLVLVAAVAALAERLHAHHSATGLAIFAGLFVPVWWLWWGYTWFSAGFDSEDPVVRLAVLLAMGAVATVAAGVGDAAGGHSRAFVLAYAAFFLLLGGLYVRVWRMTPAVRPLAVRYAVGDLAGGAIWLASLALPEDRRPWAWAVAMLVLMAAPVAAAGSLAFISYDRRHIAERYGLATLIVLGESVATVVAGLDTGGSASAVLTALAGFAIAAGIWWVYFDRWRPMPGGGLRAGWVWAQGHILVFAGIAAIAVGVRLAVDAAAAGVHPSLDARLPLGAGLAAYLLAMAAIRAATRSADGVVALRAGTAAALLVVALVADLPALAVVLLSAAILLGEAAVEMTRSPAPEAHEPHRLPHERPIARN
jgi:low temperature requirement protein LtrA